MLTAHMHEKRDLGGGQYGSGGGGGAIDEKSCSDQPPPPPPPAQRDPSDPTISARKLPKKRKFDPSELEEMDKTSNVASKLSNIVGIRPTAQPLNQSTLVHSTLPLNQQRSPQNESYQVNLSSNSNQDEFKTMYTASTRKRVCSSRKCNTFISSKFDKVITFKSCIF